MTTDMMTWGTEAGGAESEIMAFGSQYNEPFLVIQLHGLDLIRQLIIYLP